MKISIKNVELIALPPKPSILGQIIGGGIGGYCGGIAGLIPGFLIWIGMGGSTGGSGPSGKIIIATAFAGAGAYYGLKKGGKYLSRKPKIVANMSNWTLNEKKTFIQSKLIIN